MLSSGHTRSGSSPRSFRILTKAHATAAPGGGLCDCEPNEYIRPAFSAVRSHDPLGDLLNTVQKTSTLLNSSQLYFIVFTEVA
jgi:hypothetical protein